MISVFQPSWGHGAPNKKAMLFGGIAYVWKISFTGITQGLSRNRKE